MLYLRRFCSREDGVCGCVVRRKVLDDDGSRVTQLFEVARARARLGAATDDGRGMRGVGWCDGWF